MIRELENISSRVFGFIITAFSLLAFLGAMKVSNYYSGTIHSYDSQYLTLALLITVIWYIGVFGTNISKLYRLKSLIKILIDCFLFVVSATGLLAILVWLLRLDKIDLTLLLFFGAIDFILLILFGIVSSVYHKSLRKTGMNTRNVIVIADENSIEFIERLDYHKDWGYKIMAIISDSDVISEIFGTRVEVITPPYSLSNLLKSLVVDEVMYFKNDINQDEIRSLVHDCEEIGVIFRMQSAFFQMASTKTHLSYYNGIPFLTFDNTPLNKISHHWKNVVDLVASFFVLLIWLPILIIIALAIKLTSKGPVIFKQRRVGLRGREFNIYKFRTMVQDAEKLRSIVEKQNEMDGPVFKMKNDPRITRIGKFLRKTGLDEMPQFFNVLKGDMSLVGPRPPLPAEVEQYERWQLRRLSMKPGITCIWQIAPNRNGISFDEWMKLDLQYIDSWSLKIDLFLLFRTLKTIARGSGQ